jgi:hypothetical protein
LRIIAHYHLDHWSARFDGGSPDSFGGPDAFTAMLRLLENSPARHLTLDDFEPDLEECRLNRVAFVLIDRDVEAGNRTGKSRCPECRGSGQYVGLNLVETCRTCRGRGLVP